MENARSTTRAVVVGHLMLTAPALAVVLFVPFFGLRMFGPRKLPYYLIAGIAVAWQWYLVALPSWEKWLAGKGVPQEEVANLAHRAGLAWPGITVVGFLALHTTAAAMCGIHFGPWLLSRWYVWILPLLGMSSHAPTGNDWLQHFELVSIVPAFVVGYLLSGHFKRSATSAWILPTAILAYELLRFVEPRVSVLALHSSTRFQYFFVIQRTMPTFTPGFGGVDPVRVALQMSVVAPFYAGLAYTAGALAATHRLFGRGGNSSLISSRNWNSENKPLLMSFRESRRSTRVPLRVTIAIEGGTECEAVTIVVNLHGALLEAAIELRAGTSISIRVHVTDKRSAGRVVYVDPENPLQCGIELEKPQNIWGVPLPPDDWEDRT